MNLRDIALDFDTELKHVFFRAWAPMLLLTVHTILQTSASPKNDQGLNDHNLEYPCDSLALPRT